MVREVFSISKFLLKSEWLNRSGTNMWLSRKLDLRLVNFGAIDIKSWKYSDVLEEENIETLDSRRVWCHFSSWSESMDSYRHLWLRLKLYDLRVFSRDEAVGQKLKMPTLSGHPPPLSPFRYSFCLEYFKKVYLVHEWTHLPTAFVICPLWSSANKVFSTCHPARLKSTSQMYSLGTQMHYFPFSAII